MNLIKRKENRWPADLREFWDRMWGDGDAELFGHLPEAFRARPVPPVNVAETEEAYTVTVDCPGLDEKDLQVAMMGNQLVVSGERKWESEKKEKDFRRVESQYGTFERRITLPTNVRLDPQGIDATYDRGVLTVELPKLEKTPASKIPVHAGK